MSESVNKRLTALVAKAETLAQKELERIALKLLRRNKKRYTEFVMAMGVATFTTTDNRIVGVDEDPRFAELDRFLQYWDDMFKLTGNPVRFKHDGVRVTDW